MLLYTDVSCIHVLCNFYEITYNDCKLNFFSFLVWQKALTVNDNDYNRDYDNDNGNENDCDNDQIQLITKDISYKKI